MLARFLIGVGVAGLLGSALLPERVEFPIRVPSMLATSGYHFIVVRPPQDSQGIPLLVAGFSALAIAIRRLRQRPG